MRKTLEAISLGMLAVLFWMTYSAVHGPAPLPERVPTHFDIAGRPNAWGSPSGIFLLPAIAGALYLLITVGALFPASFKYPIRVTEENRPRLEALSRQMLAWVKVDLVCLFAWIQWNIIAAMRQERFTMSPATVPAFMVLILGTTAWYIVAMIRAGRQGSGS
jgi:uncharacterized membrane protein